MTRFPRFAVKDGEYGESERPRFWYGVTEDQSLPSVEAGDTMLPRAAFITGVDRDQYRFGWRSFRDK